MFFLDKLRSFLEKLDHFRDKLLFIFIKPFWPKKIEPNHISYFRIVIALSIIILLFFLGIDDKALIISLFSIGIVSDLFDGSVARAFKKETEFGAMLDPIADRILVLPIAIYSLYKFDKWLLLALLLVEVAGALISVFYKSKEVYKANIFGKTRMVMVSVVFVSILIVWPRTPPLIFIDLLWASLIFSLLSIFTRMMDLSKKGLIRNKVINKRNKSIKL